MTSSPGAIYSGRVVHRRLSPKAHLLQYSVFSVLLNIGRLDDVKKHAPLLKINRFGLLSFHESDHGDGRESGLRDWVDEQLSAAGIDPTDIQVSVLCYPRILGYVFNPLTAYFCDRKDGSTAAIIYQVNNTMGERHSYMIPVAAGTPVPIRHVCSKEMYVSPFTPMESIYNFSVVPPKDKVCVVIQQTNEDGPILNASFTGDRQPLTSRTLFDALLRHPLMTLKVIAGIHYEAFRLWRKKVPVFSHRPKSAKTDITITPQQPMKTV